MTVGREVLVELGHVERAELDRAEQQ